mgnify:CR=1 FL=1
MAKGQCYGHFDQTSMKTQLIMGQLFCQLYILMSFPGQFGPNVDYQGKNIAYRPPEVKFRKISKKEFLCHIYTTYSKLLKGGGREKRIYKHKY